MTIQDFQKTVSRSNVGFLDIENGVLVKHDTHKVLQFTHATPDLEKNLAVRTALFNALVNDCCGLSVSQDYVERLHAELLAGDKGTSTLLRTTVKSLLDRHARLKDTLDISGPQEALQVQTAEREAVTGEDVGRIGGLIGGAGRTAAKKLSALEIMERLPADVLKPDFVAKIKGEAEAAEKKLGDAYRLVGKEIRSEDGQRKLADAVKALVELGEDLRRVFNGLVRKSDSADVREAGRYAVPDGLQSAIAYCLSRAAEVEDVRRAALRLVPSERRVDEQVADRAMKMHGSEDFVRFVSAKAKALSGQVGELEAARSQSVPADRIRKLTDRVEALRAQVLSAGDDGLDLRNGGVFVVDRSLADALLRELNVLSRRLEKISSSTFATLADNLLDEFLVRSMKGKSKTYVDMAKTLRADLSRVVRQEAWKESAHNLINTYNHDHIRDKYLPPPLLPEGLAALMGALVMLDKQCGDGLKMKAEHLLAVLNGRTGVGTVIAANAFGFELEDVDVRLDDKNLVESGKLGEGHASEVFQLTYSVPGRDGRPEKLTRVFKPEVTARIGLTTISAGVDNAAVNSVTRLNRATRRAAEFLGVGQLVDPITVGMHDGRLGFFMTKADAMHPGAVWMRAGTSEPGWNRTKGTLLRELTCLAWLDWLTGQMDRHGRNYLVSIDSNDEAVVKGIDNDTSFAATRRGVQKFELTKNRLQDLLYCEGGGTTAEAFMERYKDYIRTIVDDPPRKPPRHELDLAGASKHLVDLVIKAYGVNSMSRPRLITQSMYGKLAALEGKDDKEYLAMAAQIMGRPGFTADQYTATANRLREMVDYVKKVPSDVTVVPDEEWTRLDRVNNLADLARTGLTDARAGYLERDFH